jgi:glycerol uptake operon antiterminator
MLLTSNLKNRKIECGVFMTTNDLKDILECNPVIAAFQDCWDNAIESPAEVLFCLKAKLSDIAENTKNAHKNGKKVFVHIDLAEGIGKDKEGILFLKKCSVDGIISTKGQPLRIAKELGLFTVQRFFALDSKGLDVINDMAASASPDMIELMPGIVGKIIKRFSGGQFPVIAGGLIETKQEVTEALKNGAIAVSTGKKELWYL